VTIIVTGAAGFIGANIVQALNARGEKNIIVVDDLRPADKYRNLADLDIIDYLDKDEFLEAFRSGRFGKVKAVFHEGAISVENCKRPAARLRSIISLRPGS
jgi:ADP-L-glycero-D-manno-heptose 6-epimerase